MSRRKKDWFPESWKQFWKSAVPEKGPEIVIGLVAPLGVDLEAVRDALRASFAMFTYDVEYVVVSNWLKELSTALVSREAASEPENQRIKDLQDTGNALRQRLAEPSAVALLSCLEIRKRRREATGSWVSQKARRVYLIRSLKRPEELTKLREIYGRGFLALAVYTPFKQRKEYLRRKLHGAAAAAEIDTIVDDLLERDEFESEAEHVQNVRDTFYRADAFVDAADRKALRSQVDRFVELIFGHPWRTPTLDEQAMMFADIARLRSAAPYRQVGAALVRKTGELAGIGCNDVPRPGGGLFWEGDSDDKRDFRLDRDLSDEKKREALREILVILGKKKVGGGQDLLNVSVQELITEPKLHELMEDLKSTRLANLIEFYRTAHAEMEAVLSAAREGFDVRDCMLFSTTFPCHECTRNLITAGITRVVFMEPYPKSLTPELFKDIVSIDGGEKEINTVSFEPFVGIGPRLYREVFGSRKRKTGTKLIGRPSPDTRPRFGLYEPGSLLNEFLEVERVTENLIDKGLITEDELKRVSLS